MVLNLSVELAGWLQKTLGFVADASDDEDSAPDRESALAILDLMRTGGGDGDNELHPNGDPDPNVIPYGESRANRRRLEIEIERLSHLATSAIVAKLKDQGATEQLVCKVLKRDREGGLGYMQGRGAA